jgi:uncharacterized protein YbjT (DUF2867 family)
MSPGGDGPIPLVDVRDLGPMLLSALLAPGFAGRTGAATSDFSS